MRVAVLSLALLVGACIKGADVELEIHRATSSSMVWFAICDAATPDHCGDAFQEGLNFEGTDTVHTLGIYVEDGLVAPLGVRLLQLQPQTCRLVELEPAREPGPVVLTLPTMANADLTIGNCSTCTQQPACLP